MNENLRGELKRQRQLLEYDYHVPEDSDIRHDKEIKNILGEEDPEAEVGDEEEQQDQDQGGGEEDIGTEELPDDLGGEEEGPAPADDGLEGDTGDEDVEEVDVTELVKYAEEAKDTAEKGNEKVEQLFSKFEELENKLTYMDQITQKIEDLESEVEKRNPTGEEQLEMRSFDSYPYNLKLTDYWGEKSGYQATDEEDEIYDEENDEYVLRASDVENDYSEQAVKNSIEKDEDEYNSFPFNL